MTISTSTEHGLELRDNTPVEAKRIGFRAGVDAGKPRIVFVSPTIYPVLSGRLDIYGAGGAEVQQTEIIRLLRSMDYPVSVITSDYGQREREEHNGVTIDKLPRPGQRGIKGLRFIHPQLTDFLPLLARQKPDVIYTRCAGAHLAPCAYYAKRHGAKFIYHSANDLEFGKDAIPGLSWREAALFRWALKRSDLVIVQNSRQKHSLEASWGRQGVVVPSSLEDASAQPAQFDGPILLVGTVKPVKRPELFLELARRMPERRFRIVGGPGGSSGSPMHYYEEIARRCSELPNVEMIGFVHYAQVGKYFDGGAVLVNTSEAEGFPNTFLQSWLRRMPTLSFVAPADENDVTGTQVASDLEDMVCQLRQLTTDRTAWARAANQGYEQYLRHHSSKAAAQTYDRLLLTLSERSR